jgi:hypothetical protein
VSDQGSQFVARFWEQLHASLRTHLIYSSAYHPQTDDQTEWVNQILEDMLRVCMMEHQGSWDKNLPLAEFSYNNSYQESLKMTLFQVLYGRWCRTPLNWIEPGEKTIFGLDLIDEVEATVHHIQNNLKAMRSHQESYANKRCWPLVFDVGDHVYVRVSLMKGVKRFGMKGKLTFTHTREVWTHGMHVGVVAILGRSSWHLPRITTEEVSQSTRGCSTARSDTTQSRFDLSRALN